MKQVILLRNDLKMPLGKASVQVAHASVEATLKSEKKAVEEWRREGMKKVVLKVNDEKELLEYRKLADQAKLTNALITDAAKTFFNEPTTTCLAIGPDDEEKIDKLTGKLKMA
ncbi:peptidyl-tRNA hydrolase [Candidatus Woesearchaeota archaeon]|nr:peptidyl-tRNA hydrolase [Candidatus Woesearchaeota archaeon]